MKTLKVTGILKRGNKGEEVKALQEKLLEMGSVCEDNPFWESSIMKSKGIKYGDLTEAQIRKIWIDGDFGEWTEEAVKHIQIRHIGPDGEFIEPTGIVDEATVWAINHRTDSKQDQGINMCEHSVRSAIKVKKTGQVRKKVLETAYKYLGVKERPKGSNSGKYIDKFTGGRHWAWCASFTCYVFNEATGNYYAGPKGKSKDKWTSNPSVWRLRKYSKALGIFKTKGKEDPEIGDIYSMNYGGGRGHTGLITGLRKKKGKIIGIYTISGNENDSVREGYRSLSSKTLVGFIDPYKDDEVLKKFKRANKKAKDSSKEKTR